MVDVLGTQLGRYDVRERLGQGGMAAVYKAWDANLDRWVAIKVLHDHLAGEPALKERFRREAKVVARLNHPNIVQVYDFGAIERNGLPIYYMVMAYMPGPSLRDIIDQKRSCGEQFILSEIENIMRGICSALAYAHAQGMIHRDVKPGNILFGDQGQAVLADFGIARMVAGDRLTQTGATSGTPLYMSPEQATGQNADHRSDLYSLGVILYELLAGHAPFLGESAVAIIMKHINDPMPPLPDMDGVTAGVMQAVLFRALAKDPQQRYQSAAAFLTDFEQAASISVPASDRPPHNTLRIPELAAAAGKRRASWIWLAAGVLGLTLTAIGLVMFSSDRSSAASDPTNTAVAQVLTTTPTTGSTSYASSMTTGPLIFKDDFGSDRGDLIWPITTNNEQVYRNIENGYYLIRHTRPATGLATIFDEEHQYASGFVYEADFTISEKSQNDTATGIIFRYRDDANYYVFSINGQGQVSMWLRADGTWTELRRQPTNWTLADGARFKGQPNHLKLVDDGKQLQGYVNDNLAITVGNDPTVVSGAIGIYLATTSSQKVLNPFAEVQVDNFSVTYYLAPSETPKSTTTNTITSSPTTTATSTPSLTATDTSTATAIATATNTATRTLRPRVTSRPRATATSAPAGGSSDGGGGNPTSQPQPTQGGGGILPTLPIKLP
jgi:serine/threonine protein kinase